ncbi:L-type lectin family protein [Levilactobacillus tujiorum]|uniref:hypothetical protein n=1 Tax=Levilactobacillus tujiorum TaxID=2912243 RepID=UPI001456386C|nr:hypothetical protein [Levilactobacillus tujiorum]NLR32838.1 hypothetical protein [Levilactobacillus tujiorum]
MSRKVWLVVGALALVWGLGGVQTAHATDGTDLTNGLNTVPQGLELSKYFQPGTSSNNQAHVVDGTNLASPDTQVVELTTGSPQVGSIWSFPSFKFRLNEKQVASMWLNFGSKGVNTGQGTPGDGMALVLQNAQSPYTATPNFGGHEPYGETLGVWGVANQNNMTTDAVAKTAIQNSWALEFDTFMNQSTTGSDASSFDAYGLYGPHIASNYPAQSGSYTAKSGYILLNHLGAIKGTNNNFLADGMWHHLTLVYTPQSGSTSAKMSYTFNDKNPTTGASQTGKTQSVNIDPAIIDPANTGQAVWGFTGSTGANSEANMVAFEEIPGLVNASATASLAANGKDVTTGDKISAHSPVTLTYNANYESGSETWSDIQANLKIPKGVTITKGTIDYGDNESTTLGAVDIDNINQGKGITLAKGLDQSNSTAKITLKGTVNDVTKSTYVSSTLSSFKGSNAVVQATTIPSFTIVPSTLHLATDQSSISADGTKPVDVTGTVTDTANAVNNSNLVIHGTLNDSTDLDDTDLSTSDAAGKFSVAVPADKLQSGANILDLTAEDKTTGALSNVGEVIITLGELKFKTVTGNVNYQAQLTGAQQLVSRAGSSDLSIVVEDTRTGGNPWYLTATASPLVDKNGNQLAGNLVYVNGNQTTTLSNTAATVLTHAADSSSPTTDVTGDWSAKQGLLLDLDADAMQSKENYTSGINWTLTNSVQ